MPLPLFFFLSFFLQVWPERKLHHGHLNTKLGRSITKPELNGLIDGTQNKTGRKMVQWLQHFLNILALWGAGKCI